MSLVLDTHAAVWYALGSDRLSATARQRIDAAVASDLVYFSTITQDPPLRGRDGMVTGTLSANPSLVLSAKHNYLINPAHPDVAQMERNYSGTPNRLNWAKNAAFPGCEH